MDKHPVSLLQEKMAKSHKALPTYMIEQVGNMFAYTVKVDGITVVGMGYSKSSAKYNAANRALSRLVDDEPRPFATNLPSINGENYIGALNDLASKHKLPLPIYAESVVPNMNNMFCVECQLLGHSTKGYGSIKKQAKQQAALEMLIVLRTGLTDLLKRRANIESVTEQFEMLKNQGITKPDNKTNSVFESASSSVSIKNICRLSTGLTDLLKQRANIGSVTDEFEMLKNQGITKPDNKTNLVFESASSSGEKMSTKYMWSELQKYVSVPLLQILETNPDYILSLNIDDDCKTTIVETGKTYAEAEYNLLKKALFLIKRL